MRPSRPAARRPCGGREQVPPPANSRYAAGNVSSLHIRAALTRKAFLFAGSNEGGRRAAIAYTILGSWRLAGVHPLEYLADVLPKLVRGISPSEAAAILPAAWRDQRAAVQTNLPAQG